MKLTAHLQASLLFLATSMSLPLFAADAATAASGAPNAKALSHLCATCAIVSGVHTEQRKGKASGLGAVGGGFLGNALEKNMKKTTVWVIAVTRKDGSKHSYEASSAPSLRAGDVVDLASGHPVRK